MFVKKIFTIGAYWGIYTAIMLLSFNASFAQEYEENIKYEAGFYYTVQKGDTLWDLSEHFFDSPFEWPGLWKENRQILNPHLIYPGERIRLFQRGWVEKPVKAENDKKALAEQEKKLHVGSHKETPYYLYTSIEKTGFVRKKPATPNGFIFKVKEDKEMISTGDLVYIRPSEKTIFQMGSKYTVYRTLGPVKEKKTNTYAGIQHYLTGTVKITKIEPDFVLARVVQSFRTIRLNDLLMPYQYRSEKIILTPSKKGLSGRIILAEEHGNLIGEKAVVFINKGNKDGVKPGQSYSIYYQEKKLLEPKKKKYVHLTPVDLGRMIVLHTQETTSTVLITKSLKTIYPGTRFRSP